MGSNAIGPHNDAEVDIGQIPTQADRNPASMVRSGAASAHSCWQSIQTRCIWSRLRSRILHPTRPIRWNWIDTAIDPHDGHGRSLWNGFIRRLPPTRDCSRVVSSQALRKRVGWVRDCGVLAPEPLASAPTAELHERSVTALLTRDDILVVAYPAATSHLYPRTREAPSTSLAALAPEPKDALARAEWLADGLSSLAPRVGGLLRMIKGRSPRRWPGRSPAVMDRLAAIVAG
jgi:hypothetical protein